MAVARKDLVLTYRFNTCPPYLKVESKSTRDFAPQCSLLTYTRLDSTLQH